MWAGLREAHSPSGWAHTIAPWIHFTIADSWLAFYGSGSHLRSRSVHLAENAESFGPFQGLNRAWNCEPVSISFFIFFHFMSWVCNHFNCLVMMHSYVGLSVVESAKEVNGCGLYFDAKACCVQVPIAANQIMVWERPKCVLKLKAESLWFCPRFKMPRFQCSLSVQSISWWKGNCQSLSTYFNYLWTRLL